MQLELAVPGPDDQAGQLASPLRLHLGRLQVIDPGRERVHRTRRAVQPDLAGRALRHDPDDPVARHRELAEFLHDGAIREREHQAGRVPDLRHDGIARAGRDQQQGLGVVSRSR
ncbi:MAG TPA: hypothetical protein VNO54_14340 [Streptosporangiaceae bacterium]|nr:hypothetical protein [Streptosporangiaceae bacterium]